MSDIVLSPQTLAVVSLVVGSVVSALLAVVSALVAVVGGLVYVYRQDIRTRDRLLDEVSRDRDEAKIRNIALEGAVERHQTVTVDAMAVARLYVEEAHARKS